MIRSILLFLAFVACELYVEAQKPCDGVLGQQFRPDNGDCRRYHLCGKGKDWTLNCGKHHVWNQGALRCVPIGSANDTCSKKNQWIVTAPVLSSPPVPALNLRSLSEWNYNPFGESQWRPTCLPGSKQRFAHPTRCAQYYDCGSNPREDWWGKHVRECEYPTVYNERTGSCGYYTEVNCGARKIPLDPCDYLSYRCRSSHCVPCYIRYASCAGMKNGINVWRGRERSPFFVICKDERVVFHGRCVSPEPGKRHIFDSRYNTCVRSMDNMSGKIPTIDFNNMFYTEVPYTRDSHHKNQNNPRQFHSSSGSHTVTKVGNHNVRPDFNKGNNFRKFPMPTKPSVPQNNFKQNSGPHQHQHSSFNQHSSHPPNGPPQRFNKPPPRPENRPPPHNNNSPPNRNRFSGPQGGMRQNQMPMNAAPTPKFSPHQPKPGHGPQHSSFNSPQNGQGPQYPPYERPQNQQPYDHMKGRPKPPQPKPPQPISGPPQHSPYDHKNNQPNGPSGNPHPPGKGSHYKVDMRTTQNGKPNNGGPVYQMAAFEQPAQVHLPPQAPTTREHSIVSHQPKFRNEHGPNAQPKQNQQQYKPQNKFNHKLPEPKPWQKPKTILSQGSWHQSTNNQHSKNTPPQPKRNNPPPGNKWHPQNQKSQPANRWQPIPHKALSPEPKPVDSKPTPTNPTFNPHSQHGGINSPRRKEMVVQPVRREMIKKPAPSWNNQQHKPAFEGHHQSNTQNNLQKNPSQNHQMPKHGGHTQQRYDPNANQNSRHQYQPPQAPPPQKPKPNTHANQRPPQHSFGQKPHQLSQNKPPNTFNHQSYHPPKNNHNRPHHNQRPHQAPNKMPEQPQPRKPHMPKPAPHPNQHNPQSRIQPPHQHNKQTPPRNQMFHQQSQHGPKHHTQNPPIQHQNQPPHQPNKHGQQPIFKPPNMQHNQKVHMYPQQPPQQQNTNNPHQHNNQNKPGPNMNQNKAGQQINQNKPGHQHGPYKQQPINWQKSRDVAGGHNKGPSNVPEQKPAFSSNSWSPTGSNSQPYQPRNQNQPNNFQPASTVVTNFMNQNQQPGHGNNRPPPPPPPGKPTSHPQYRYHPTKSTQFSSGRHNPPGNFNPPFERRV